MSTPSSNRHIVLWATAAVLSWCLAAPPLPGAEEDDAAIETRVHDVTEVLRKHPAVVAVVAPRGGLALAGWRGVPEGTFWPGVPREPVFRQVDEGAFAFTEDAAEGSWLVERLRETLIGSGHRFPDTGGARPGITVEHGQLVVRAEAEVQEIVDGLLRALRLGRESRVLVEMVLAPAAVLDRLAPSWRSDGPRLEAELLESVLLSPASRLLSVAAVAGDWETASSGRSETLLSDFEINQTGVIPVSNPVMQDAAAGEWLQCRAVPLPGTGEVRIDALVGSYGLAPKERSIGPAWSELDLSVRSEALLSLALTAPPGRTLVAGRLDDRVVLLRVTPQQRSASPARRTEAPDGGTVLRGHDVSPLSRLEKVRSWWEHWPSPGVPGGFEVDLGGSDGPPLPDPTTLAALVRLTGMSGVEELETRLYRDPRHRVLLLSATPDVHERVDRYIRAEAARRARDVAVTLDLLELDRERFVKLRSLSPDGLLLAEGWREQIATGAKLAGREYAVTGVVAETHAVRVADIHPIVTHVEGISGGTGFAIIEMTDPVIQTCGEGAELRVRVDLLPEKGTARLEVRGLDTKLREIREVRVGYPSLSGTEEAAGMATGGEGQGGSVPIPRRQDVILHLPKQRVRTVEFRRRVPLDRDIILHADTADGETATVLVGRVREVR